MGATTTEFVAIEFGTEVENLFQLTDGAFIRAVRWKDPVIAEAASLENSDIPGDPLTIAGLIQKKWLEKFSARSGKQSQKKLVTTWSKDSFAPTTLTEKLEPLVQEWSAKKPETTITSLIAILQEFDSEFKDISAFDLLLVSELLLKSYTRISLIDFWTLWRWCASQFLNHATHLETMAGTETTPDQIVILAGEIPWLGGQLFKDIEGADQLRKTGKKALKQALSENIDNDGTPNAPLLERSDYWIASLVRSAGWGDLLGKRLWKGDHEELYDSLLQSAAQLCQTDGRFPLTSIESGRPPLPEILYQGMMTSGFSPKSKPVRYINYLREGSVKNSSQALIDSRKWGQVKKSISSQSDWSQLACLRSGWALDHDSIVLAHHQEIPQIAMSILGQSLFSGEWDLELKVRGRRRKLSADWSCTCWYSDREIDYIEIQLPLTGDLHLDRQLFLSRTEHFALLVDSVAGLKDQKFELKSRLPLTGQVSSEVDQLTREVRLKCAGESIRVLPLALPQFRTHSATGELSVLDDQLVLSQAGQSAVASPLFLDWSPRRRRFKADWRTLTVTENRRRLTPSDAFASRVRFKNQQWMYYRDLISDKEWPHAVLGMHSNHETVFGRFDSDGDVQPIVHVE